MNITANNKPKWYQFRWKLSNFFVKLAKAIYKENPEVNAFYLKAMNDFMIYGGYITNIDYKKAIEDEIYLEESV